MILKIVKLFLALLWCCGHCGVTSKAVPSVYLLLYAGFLGSLVQSRCGEGGCCKQIALSCAHSVSALLDLSLLAAYKLLWLYDAQPDTNTLKSHIFFPQPGCNQRWSRVDPDPPRSILRAVDLFLFITRKPPTHSPLEATKSLTTPRNCSILLPNCGLKGGLSLLSQRATLFSLASITGVLLLEEVSTFCPTNPWQACSVLYIHTLT